MTTEKRTDSKAELKAAIEAKRAKQERQPPKPVGPMPVSLGPVDKIVDVLVNPTPDKILEFTDLDRNQVTLIPQVGVLDDVWDYCEQIATFRHNAESYIENYQKDYPMQPNPAKRFVHLLAQCRRSLGGKTQKALEDLALADLETRVSDTDLISGHKFDDD